MLRFQQIEIENFGAYKGRQVLDFPEDDGVIVVYGENGHGKTTLLNAFRFALFGKVKREGHEDVGLERIPNIEAARDGDHSFRVVVRFTSGGESYELTRAATSRVEGVPKSSEEFRVDVILRRSGDALGPDESSVVLARVMPEVVSRFFLFDGELLREYEELLKRGSKLGDAIKMAIERILGVPVLTHAQDDLKILHEQTQKDVRSVAAQNQESEKLAAELGNLAAQREHLQSEVERMEAELRDLGGEKADLDDFLSRHAQAKARIEQRKDLESKVSASGEKIEVLRLELKERMGNAWRGMLGEKVREARDRLRDEIARLKAQAAAADLAARIEKSLSEGSCSLCAQALKEPAVVRLRTELADAKSGSGDGDASRVALLTGQVERLGKFGLRDERALARRVGEELREAIVEQEDLRAELKRVRSQTQAFADQEEGIGEKQERYDQVVEEMKVLRDGIDKNKGEISDNADARRAMSQNLDRLGNPDIDAARRRDDFYRRLHDLFREGVGEYRERLRERVEADASSLFAALKHKQDYSGLRINENYGLSIVLDSGEEIPGHSAGEGQVVALSLIGALQKNAPLQGPIIMDSSFTRLDGRHKRNLLQALPSMSPQVMLLVFEEELAPGVIREHVGARLLAEYEMDSRSATHTVLQRKTQ